MCPKLEKNSGRKYSQEVKTHLLTSRLSSAPQGTQGLGRDTAQRLSALDFTGSGSHWDEEVGVRKVGVPVPLGRASVVAVVTSLNRASYFSALAKHCCSVQERLE